MKYVKGRFLNLNGLESRFFYCHVPPEKEIDLAEAFQLAKGKDIIVMASDWGDRVRLAQIKGRFYRNVPQNVHVHGSVISSVRLANDNPMQTVDFIRTVPQIEEDRQIQAIAEMHLPKLEQLHHVRHLPK